MKILLYLLVAASTAAAAVVPQGGAAVGDAEVSTRMTGGHTQYDPSLASVSANVVAERTVNEDFTYDSVEAFSLRPREKDDVVEIYLKKDFKGQYYFYTSEDTDSSICKTFTRLVGEHLESVWQKRPEHRSNVRCHYYAEPNCGVAGGELTQENLWQQGDLDKEPRRFWVDVFETLLVGTWRDQITSVQCSWIREANERGQRIEELETYSESENERDADIGTSDVAKPLEGISIATPKTKRDGTNSNQRLTELYLLEEYSGNPIAWATEQDAEEEKCVVVNLPKNGPVRSILQGKDDENRWFVCWYYDDNECNANWTQNGKFDTFYLEQEQSISKMAKGVRSMKCLYH